MHLESINHSINALLSIAAQDAAMTPITGDKNK